MENEAFRNIKVSGEKGKYVLAGETRQRNGEFYYIVEDGHNELVSQKQVQTKGNFHTWSKFTIEINIPKEIFPQNGTIILYLFERNKNGEMINDLPVILEEIKQADK